MTGELLDAVFENRVECWRAATPWSAGGVVHEAGGAMCCGHGATKDAFFSGLFRTEKEADAAAVIAVAETFFSARGQGYTARMYAGAQDDDLAAACTAAGFAEASHQPAQMALVAPAPQVAAADDVELTFFGSPGDVAIFGAVNDLAYAEYGFPGGSVSATYADTAAVAGDPRIRGCIVSVGGTPAATALAFASHGITSILWVGTVPAFRGRRLGAMATAALADAALADGAGAAVLTATAAGEPVYRSLGFEVIARTRNFARAA